MVGFERFGREKLTQDVWTDGILNEEKATGKEQSAIQEGKEALKQRIDLEIVRLGENIREIKEKQERLVTLIEELRAEISLDEGMDPTVTGVRLAILKGYEKDKSEGAVRLRGDKSELKEQMTRYQRVFGVPFIKG